MKKFLIALNIVIWSFVSYQTTAHAVETKLVCKPGPNGKQTCKTIKVHKKLDGTKVPEKKKK
jgi:hypothetical protein